MSEQSVTDISRVDLLSDAWGVIANAYEGDWEKATPEWREAAERWRDAWDGQPCGTWPDAWSIDPRDYTAAECFVAGRLSTMPPFASEFSPRALPFARAALEAMGDWIPDE